MSVVEDFEANDDVSNDQHEGATAQQQRLHSVAIRDIATRALENPALVTLKEVQELAAAVVAHISRSHQSHKHEMKQPVRRR
jgi:hypothetical protein